MVEVVLLDSRLEANNSQIWGGGNLTPFLFILQLWQVEESEELNQKYLGKWAPPYTRYEKTQMAVTPK